MRAGTAVLEYQPHLIKTMKSQSIRLQMRRGVSLYSRNLFKLQVTCRRPLHNLAPFTNSNLKHQMEHFLRHVPLVMICIWSTTICQRSIRTPILPKGLSNNSTITSVLRPRNSFQTPTHWARVWTIRRRVLWRRCMHKMGCISLRRTYRGRFRTTRAYSRRRVTRWPPRESNRCKGLLRQRLGKVQRGSHTTRRRSRSKEREGALALPTQWHRWSSTTCPRYRHLISNLKAIRHNTSKEWWGRHPDPSPLFQLICQDRLITITHSKL